MVWPILISVDVTPRISAEIAAAGSIRQATAPSAPIEVTKRIGIPPLLLCRHSAQGRAARPVSGSSEQKHAMRQGLTPTLIAAGGAQRVTSFNLFEGFEIPLE